MDLCIGKSKWCSNADVENNGHLCNSTWKMILVHQLDFVHTEENENDENSEKINRNWITPANPALYDTFDAIMV